MVFRVIVFVSLQANDGFCSTQALMSSKSFSRPNIMYGHILLATKKLSATAILFQRM